MWQLRLEEQGANPMGEVMLGHEERLKRSTFPKTAVGTALGAVDDHSRTSKGCCRFYRSTVFE